MKIVHLCLSCFYIDNYGYQENFLPRQNKLDGHDVVIIASTETISGNRQLRYVEPQEYTNEDGIRVQRIPYRNIPGQFLRSKVRSYLRVYEMLQQEKPDVILFHGAAAWELLTVVKYKKDFPNVKLFVDSHEDANNSGRSFFSKHLLHGIFYRWIISQSLANIEKILYYSLESRDFLQSIYNVPVEKLEFYPLGGIVFDDQEYLDKRSRTRTLLRLSDDDVLLLHTGKLDCNKRTIELLQAYSTVFSKKSNLIILGSVDQNYKEILNELIQTDQRVRFLGWKSTNELQEYLCAADVYVQPGSQSATMQNAMCCRCAVMLFPHKSHQPFLDGNGFYVNTVQDMHLAMQTMIDDPELLKKMSQRSYEIAQELLDYKKLASRLYR